MIKFYMKPVRMSEIGEVWIYNFLIKTLDGTTIYKSAKVKDLNLLEARKSYLIERRKAIPLAT